MRLLNQRTIYTTLFYILFLVLIVVSKPSFAFDERGRIKPFGVGYENTIISLGVVVVALAILSFYIFACIDVVFERRC